MTAVQAPPESPHFIKQIAYCSLASPSVKTLGIVSQLQNMPQGLTGLLMWEGRLLIHWIEGPEHEVQTVWSQVQNDPHHHCVVRLIHRQGSIKRLFADWQMRATHRQDMMVIVREAKAQASKAASDDTETEQLQWQHAISTLSILLDPDLTRFYSQSAAPSKSMLEAAA
ncbi:BLUF domain-containing protein [Variovorax sp. PCZ-1]|uniref:BLUF domain-containing protein n=1 Tax=Variovorax sp. PCZ-1 TaxID=2835533 RepID=UPI001BCD4B27|nr:BLUF domain-containing protein [Variovorax sp. PCZ-1]MBS7806252.1 BLUF domain-containing protein [Variovorax sp. PCZ-1]